MSILNNNKKYEITLSAIAVNDKLNKDHKACGISFTNNKEIYLPLCGCGNMPVLHRRLLELLSNQKEAINVNINSFLKLANPDHQQTIVNSFFTIDDFLTNKYSLKTTKSKRIEHNFIIDAIKYANLIKIAKVITEAENLSKTLMVMPSNYLTVDEFERIVKNKFQGLKNIKFSVLHKSELTKKKMGLILAVGKASPKVNEPRIIVVEYNNTPSKKKIALVGKGIIFDTGGLHLKPGESMTGMHGDMSGAALTLASIYAMAKLNINANVVGVAALATNEISADAYRVNDVITSYSGKTVEILNTDAEGRLALADGIAYAKRDLKANTIMTVATLTGAICIALGETYTGI
jgi:leucyl aminopeptidase